MQTVTQRKTVPITPHAQTATPRTTKASGPSVHSVTSSPLPPSWVSQPSHYLAPKFSPASYSISFLVCSPGGKRWGRRGCPAALAALSCCSAFMSQLVPLKMLSISVCFVFSLQNVSLLLFLSFKCHLALLSESTQGFAILLHWG